MEAKFLISGDSAVSVQMGSEISLEVNQLVRMLFLDLTNDPVEGIVEMVPTYASLMIHYRPEKIQYSRLKEEIEGRLGSMEQVEEGSRIVKEIPICYGGELGPDLEDCAAVENVSSKEFIRMHSEHEYYTYMLGFAPGHAYMARFEEPFHFTICDHTKKDPFLVHAGEWVRYVPVGRREYEKIKEDVRRGTYRLKTYEKAVK